MQKEVLEELEHHFPLDVLVELSEAAIDTLQARPVVVHLDAPEAWQGLEPMAIELKALLS